MAITRNRTAPQWVLAGRLLMRPDWQSHGTPQASPAGGRGACRRPSRWRPAAVRQRRYALRERVEDPDGPGRSSRTSDASSATVGQPSFIEAYERTSIYPKLTGYIEKWIVDIGDRVKKGEMLATLFVPELVEEYGDEEGNRDARRATDRAWPRRSSRWPRPTSRPPRPASKKSSRSWASIRRRPTAGRPRSKRLTREVSRGVVDPQVLLESNNQFKSSSAARDAARATIRKAEAEVLSYEASARQGQG